MILGAEPKNQVIWTIHCKVMAPNLQICPNMGKIDEKRPFLSRPSVNYFKNSLKSFVIMLLTAPGVKLPSYRKNGFKASWWRCARGLSTLQVIITFHVVEVDFKVDLRHFLLDTCSTCRSRVLMANAATFRPITNNDKQ